MPLDYGAIGKRIKSQYPQYAGFDDIELGRKYTEKYSLQTGGQFQPIQQPQQIERKRGYSQLVPEYVKPTSFQKFLLGLHKLGKYETLPLAGQMIAGVASVPLTMPLDVVAPGKGKLARVGVGTLGRVGGEIVRQGLQDISVGKFGHMEKERSRQQLRQMGGQVAKGLASEAISEFLLRPAMGYVGGKVGKLLGIGGKGAQVAGRPAHQAALEEASRRGDVNAIKKIIDSIPEGDPYKASMQSVFKKQLQQATGRGAKIYAQTFQVPTKLASRLKPEQTSAKLIRYGIKGNLDDIAAASRVVTGDRGVITQMTREALGQVGEDIPQTPMLGVAKNMIEQSDSITDAEGKKIISVMFKNIRPGKLPNTWNALDAFDSARQLEKIGYEHWWRGTNYLSPSIKHKQMARVYLGVADEIKSSLDKVIKGKGILDYIKYQSPKTIGWISALRSVSPELAKDVMETKSLSGLRSIAAPFAKAGQMVDLTKQASYSAFSQLARALGGAPTRVARQIATAPLRSPQLLTRLGSLLEKAPQLPRPDLTPLLQAGGRIAGQKAGMGVLDFFGELSRRGQQSRHSTTYPPQALAR